VGVIGWQNTPTLGSSMPSATSYANGAEPFRRIMSVSAAAATVAFPARRIRRDVTAGAEGDDKDAHADQASNAAICSRSAVAAE
jgi:hypothetical protein